MLEISQDKLDFKWDEMRETREAFFKYRKENTNKPLAVFGAGALGRILLQVLREEGIAVSRFIDNNPSKQGSILEGIPVFSFEKIKNELNDYDIVLCDSYAIEKQNQLISSGKMDGIYILSDIFSKDTSGYSYTYYQDHIDLFRQTFDWLEDKNSKNIFEATIQRNLTGNIHYLDQIVIQDEQGERLITQNDMVNQYFVDYVRDDYSKKVFVDAGAFTGDTIRDFIQFTQGRYGKIISIEADAINFNGLKKYVEEEKINVELYPFALYSRDGEIAFNGGGGDGSRILDGDGSVWSERVPARSLDSLLNGSRADFIKMDIEGSELEALKGAQETIRKYHPKLAICVYHRPEDMITIPQYIKLLNPEYRLFLRLHGRSSSDLVLYAVK